MLIKFHWSLYPNFYHAFQQLGFQLHDEIDYSFDHITDDGFSDRIVDQLIDLKEYDIIDLHHRTLDVRENNFRLMDVFLKRLPDWMLGDITPFKYMKENRKAWWQEDGRFNIVIDELSTKKHVFWRLCCQKRYHPFDFVNIHDTKEDLIVDDCEKQYSSFIINKALSHGADTVVPQRDEFRPHWSWLQYDFLRGIIRKKDGSTSGWNQNAKRI